MNSLSFKTLTNEYLKADPAELMSQHGKSFYFASLIFSKKRLFKIATLYRLCRFIDDCADELEDVESQKAIDSILFDLEHPEHQSEFNNLVMEVEAWGVKRSFLKELVIGAQFDARGGMIENEDDLMLYCYRVAGVVGLMMCPLIGVQDKRGYPHAIDLGIGMQLTNICRDILEDARMQRIYLPQKDVKRLGLSLAILQKEVTPVELKQLVEKFLKVADNYYLSGYRGLAYIPLRPRIVILLAGEIYRHIGLKIRSKNFEVLKGRVYLNFWEKILVSFKTMARLATSTFWKPKQHSEDLHKLIKTLPGANA